MTEQEIRLRCIEAACQVSDSDDPYLSIIATAKEFEKYVNGPRSGCETYPEVLAYRVNSLVDRPHLGTYV